MPPVLIYIYSVLSFWKWLHLVCAIELKGGYFYSKLWEQVHMPAELWPSLFMVWSSGKTDMREDNSVIQLIQVTV